MFTLGPDLTEFRGWLTAAGYSRWTIHNHISPGSTCHGHCRTSRDASCLGTPTPVGACRDDAPS
jgi:hypothetical protein